VLREGSAFSRQGPVRSVAMSRRAADAAASADLIRRRMFREQRSSDFHAAVPAMGAAALTAATAALTMHPAFAGTRAGFFDGISADVTEVMPVGDQFQTTMLRVTGACLGGAAGAKTAFEVGRGKAVFTAVGGFACALIGSEFAEPAAALGVRFGRVMGKGTKGFTADVAALFGDGDVATERQGSKSDDEKT
jgi:hypothetical protein